MKIIFAVELERYMAGTSISSIIISKLCHEKKLCPIILLKVVKNLEVSFYYTILSFGLAVCLWIENGREFLPDIKEIAYQ